jgi:hypothetical protein
LNFRDIEKLISWLFLVSFGNLNHSLINFLIAESCNSWRVIKFIGSFLDFELIWSLIKYLILNKLHTTPEIPLYWIHKYYIMEFFIVRTLFVWSFFALMFEAHAALLNTQKIKIGCLWIEFTKYVKFIVKPILQFSQFFNFQS